MIHLTSPHRPLAAGEWVSSCQ